MANQNQTWIVPFKKKTEYRYEGIKNNKKTKYKKFIKICKKSQPKLKAYLVDVLKSAGYKPIVEDGFIFAEGTNVPVCLTAHMDTVHLETVVDFYENFKDGKHIISSPQGIGGDDRCGIYIIYKIITTTEFRPTILFCEDEEIGCKGAAKFCETKHTYKLDNMKYLIELDRANADDAVFYDCFNPDFTDFIEEQTNYREAWGSYTDICELSPECGVASVNLSCGYYNAHTLGEYVVMEEMEHTIEVVKKLLRKGMDEDTPQFEYAEKTYTYKNAYYYDDYGYNDFSYLNKVNYGLKKFVILWTDGNDQFEEIYYCNSKMEALGNFFVEHDMLCYEDVLSCYED